MIPHIVTLHKTSQYCGLDCQNKFPAGNDLPEDGQFDFSVIQYVLYKYADQMTAQVIADSLYALYGLHITSQTVDKIYKRRIRMLKPTQDRYVHEIEKSNIAILDETTFKGEPKRWIGAYRNEDAVAYVHAHKRNVKDLLSQMQNCKGIPIHDGYSGYNSLFKDKNIQQRCTQHLTRAANNTARRTKLKTAKDMYREISLMFILPRKWTKGENGYVVVAPKLPHILKSYLNNVQL